MSREAGGGPGREAAEAAEVLRGIWTATGQGRADLEEAFGPARSCKTMREVGFDGMADPGADLRAAWRARLAREGKLHPAAGTLADLVLGQPRPAR